MPRNHNRLLMAIYQKLYEAFGPQDWWPGETRLEVIAGAILTQNTAWSNVEKAISNLKRGKMLDSLDRILRCGERKLAMLIRPAGYYNVKAKRLLHCMEFFKNKLGSQFDDAIWNDTAIFRDELLAVNGIGPETCDSILLYAFDRPVFVVDAYTRRIFSRHGILSGDEDYHYIQKIFMDNLPADAGLFNEFHALIVRLGKEFCKTKPACRGCPLNKSLANRFR